MSAFAFNKDTIDLLVSAAILGSPLPDDAGAERISATVATADRVGQALWKENIAAVNHVYGLSQPVPAYEWQPVADLMGKGLTDLQALQVERSRRELLDQSRENPGWEGSLAAGFLEQLGTGLARRLEAWPQQPSSSSLGVMEYSGLEAGTVAVWDRSHGFPAITRPSDSAKS